MISDFKNIFAVGLPLVFNNISSIAVNVGDTLMVARFSETHLAAIAIGTGVWITLFLFGLGLIMAISPLVAQYFGAKNFKELKSVTSQGFILASLIALIVFIIMRNVLPAYLWFGIEPNTAELAQSYLLGLSFGVFPAFYYHVLKQVSEGLGRTVPILIVMLCCLPINLTLNYLLIFGGLGIPAFGAMGCGIGSGIVFWIMFFLLFIYSKFLSTNRNIYGNFFPRYFDLSRFKKTAKLGYPIGVSLCLQTGLFSILTLMVGKLGTVQAAAHQIVLNYSGLVFMLPLGLSMAITVCVGQFAGRGDFSIARRFAFHGILLCFSLSMMTASVTYLCPVWISSIYTSDPEIQKLAIPLLKLSAMVQVGDAMQTSAAFALRGLKDTKIPMLLNFFNYWIVGFTISYVLGMQLGHGTVGIWIGLIIALFFASACLIARMFCLTKKFA